MQSLYLIRFIILMIISGILFCFGISKYMLIGIFFCAIANFLIVINMYGSPMSQEENLREYVRNADHTTAFVGYTIFSIGMWAFSQYVFRPVYLITGMTSAYAVCKLISLIYRHLYFK